MMSDSARRIPLWGTYTDGPNLLRKVFVGFVCVTSFRVYVSVVKKWQVMAPRTLNPLAAWSFDTLIDAERSPRMAHVGVSSILASQSRASALLATELLAKSKLNGRAVAYLILPRSLKSI